MKLSRTVRSVIQAVIAFCVAVPVAVTTLPIDTEVAAAASGIAAAAVVVITAVQNALENHDVIPDTRK